MKILIKTLFASFIILNIFPTNAQKKIHVHLDYSYMLGIHEKSDLWTIKSGLSGFDLGITGMYEINKQLSTGIGISLEKLYDPSYTIIPVFAKVTYSPIPSTEKPFVYTRIGYGISSGISNAGLLFNPGLGYKLRLKKHLDLNMTIGYHLQSIRYEIINHSEAGIVADKKTDYNSRHSLSLGVGFIF